MSTHENESASEGGKTANPLKPLTIMLGAAIFLSLLSTVFSLMVFLRPVGNLIEQGNSDLKESLESQGGTLAKRIDGLRDACIDWQAVLKTASEKPDATFRITKTEDGLLTLSEIKAQ